VESLSLQVIPSVATYVSIAWSVCHLSGYVIFVHLAWDI